MPASLKLKYNARGFPPNSRPSMSPSTSGSSSTLTVETFRLGPFLVPRIWTGLWQLSSNAWGTAPVSKIRQEMAKHVERGYTAFDMVRLSMIYPAPRVVLNSP
ncbi:hypothetical protein H2248_001785 [Termitomyces sp. 'cryptogamus']|nr:hypothetical protein H2248_001785 [Termitomyces sp. 'cryptogamus']